MIVYTTSDERTYDWIIGRENAKFKKDEYHF